MKIKIPKVRIYIPTMGRVGKQSTLNYFLERSTYKPYLVCPLKEEHDYDRVIYCKEKGIAKNRQYILEMAALSGVDVCIMIDDDMSFYSRNEEGRSLKTDKSLDELVEKIVDLCYRKNYIHGGVSQQAGNNHVPEDVKLNTRVNNFHFYNPAKALEAGANFSEADIMEDFWVTLTLLTSGHPNAVIFDWAWNQSSSGAQGGCSSYRTAELQTEAAHRLKERFPEFVSVVKKKTKGAGIFNGERTDVRIQWKKAFKSSGCI